MLGLSRTSGEALAGTGHIAQSIVDILTTPVGTRVMRREYGSLVPDLIDRPLHQGTLLQLYAAAVMALARWEPRVRIERIRSQADPAAAGRLLLSMDVLLTETNTRTTLEVLLGQEAAAQAPAAAANVSATLEAVLVCAGILTRPVTIASYLAATPA